ncbi:MAG: metal ABC transporter ATP-binding protein [Nitrospirae bacterium]|nr:metal ABC transporter ATP-binding protein [Nitrospirota bacterium]
MKRGPCIEIDQLCFDYNGTRVLEGVSLYVEKGDYLGIIGPNGGGKTTLLKIILGLLSPTSGQIRLFGQRGSAFRERFKIGYVSQRATQQGYYFPTTVYEITSSGRTARMGLFKRFKKDDRDAIQRAMMITEVDGHSKRLIGTLSGGERQRVFIARALAGEPEVLILDEPVVGVDIVSQERFYAFLKHLNSQFGITILFVSHDIGVISKEVSNIMCLNKRMFCHGPPNDFTHDQLIEEAYGRKVSSLSHQH